MLFGALCQTDASAFVTANGVCFTVNWFFFDALLQTDDSTSVAANGVLHC
jgi:hypothetical protein